ncbi:hypothetical protein [Chryseobacterium sp.]|uniref:hypothetical protein n=1 Tax=Chryseobacterium sp. TaxID=1871047 RepID=UPI0012C67DE9|nr:hypothetical protein [Chryseobacterium sp.]MPS65761.1 hypothetical protein [Chryseobacterium sp.]
MYLSDKNIIKAIDILKDSGVIPFKYIAFEVMGLNASRVYKIEHPEKFKTEYHFSAEQIRLFCEHFKINVNFIFGFESNMYRK